jgi:hypothetical protein
MLPRILGAANLACNSASVLFAPNDPAIRNGELISALEFTEEAAGFGRFHGCQLFVAKTPKFVYRWNLRAVLRIFFRGEIRG